MTRDDMPKLKVELQKSVRRIADFDKLKDHIEMTVTAEGLRIELMEGEGETFFESGNPVPTAEGKEFPAALAQELGKLPNKLSIEGHTDSKPFAKSGSYGNWELSADRANAARRLMQANRVSADQVTQIRGYADQQLRKKGSPEDPSNRRITVIVQYTTKGEEEAPRGGEKGSEPPKESKALKSGEAAKPAEH